MSETKHELLIEDDRNLEIIYSELEKVMPVPAKTFEAVKRQYMAERNEVMKLHKQFQKRWGDRFAVITECHEKLVAALGDFEVKNG